MVPRLRTAHLNPFAVLPALIDSWAAGPLAPGDADLREESADTRVQVEDLVIRYFHVGRGDRDGDGQRPR